MRLQGDYQLGNSGQVRKFCEHLLKVRESVQELEILWEKSNFTDDWVSEKPEVKMSRGIKIYGIDPKAGSWKPEKVRKFEFVNMV